MDLSTLIIEDKLEAFLETAYSSLLREYTFFTVAMAVSFVVFPIFAVWILNHRDRNNISEGKPYKAYTQRYQAKRGIHIMICLLMPILATRRLYVDVPRVKAVDVYGWEIIVLDILLLLLSVAAAWKLLKWRISGLLMTGAFVFFYTACVQYQQILIVTGDVSLHGKYTPVEEYTLYIVNDYGLIYAMVISLLAVIAMTAMAVYYYRRRFLFLPGKLKLPTCEYCGQMISPGDTFCTSCGKPLENRATVQVIESLDKKLYCGTCGRRINGIICLACNKGNKDELKKAAREYASEKKVSWIRKVGLAVCVVVLLLLNWTGSVMSMRSGLEKVGDAFVGCWDEFGSDPNKASNPEWLAGFDSAAKALHAVDARWYYVEPRSVKSDELIYFHLYANAAFRQMGVIEQMQQEVHAVAEGQRSAEEIKLNHAEYTNQFNQTVDEQDYALQYYDFKQEDMLGEFGYMCLNGVHAFLPMVNIAWVAIAVLMVCMAMWMVMMNDFASGTVMGWERKIQVVRIKTSARISKYAAVYKTLAVDKPLRKIAVAGINCWRSMLRIANEVWLLLVQLAGVAVLFASLFRPQNIGKCFHWLKAGLTDAKYIRAGMSETYRREQRKSSIYAVVIVIVFFAVNYGIGLGIGKDPADEQAYLNVAKAAASDYSVDIAKTLSNICMTKTLTDEEKEEFYAMIDLQIEADQTLLNYDISQLDDVQELHAGLCSLCEDDIDVLRRLQTMIDAGYVPSEELKKNYVSLRGERYLWVMQELVPEFVELGVDTILE